MPALMSHIGGAVTTWLAGAETASWFPAVPSSARSCFGNIPSQGGDVVRLSQGFIRAGWS
eukprot:CAMPEP_0182873916 /NCGR_PEP_ID=MMETSP0034_2-20130328/12618_1 /TAXON_ID=156128 /ORGANISM="Nephroselmis pyriformis, Strain CCMP717" /LENGTH=59 /DNA_ID=CAMNT_0025006599 /DNA_START=33 /DNA_END=208 /DNA_ORIENTATION=+